MPFPRVFKEYFPPCTPRCFIRIHTRLRTMQSKRPRRSTTSHGSSVSQIYALNVIQNWEMDALQFYSRVLIFW